MTKKDKSTSKGVQSDRFIEAAREAGCSEDEAVFDANLSKIVRPKEPKVAGKTRPK
jgi:hypothetical protein